MKRRLFLYSLVMVFTFLFCLITACSSKETNNSEPSVSTTVETSKLPPTNKPTPSPSPTPLPTPTPIPPVVKMIAYYEIDENDASAGAINQFTSEENPWIIEEYDGEGRIVNKVTYDYSGTKSTIIYSYGEDGRLERYTEAHDYDYNDHHSITEFECEYNEQGLLSVEKTIIEGTENLFQNIYKYDEAGQLIEKLLGVTVDKKGRIKEDGPYTQYFYEYDENGLLTQRKWEVHSEGKVLYYHLFNHSYENGLLMKEEHEYTTFWEETPRTENTYTEYKYNEAGQIIEAQVFNVYDSGTSEGSKTVYLYNEAGKLEVEEYYNDPYSKTPLKLIYKYFYGTL